MVTRNYNNTKEKYAYQKLQYYERKVCLPETTIVRKKSMLTRNYNNTKEKYAYQKLQ
jgi:hypothetical protein